MSFFDDVREPPEPAPELDRPAWTGPPSNELGVSVPLRVLLARTDIVAIALDSVVAYSAGVEFRLAGRIRARTDQSEDHIGQRLFGRPRVGPRQLLVGVQFADGRRTSSANPFFGDETPDGPVLMHQGGRSSHRAFDFGLWLWPLPPPGPLVFVCRWQEQGIEETRFEVDAGAILAAASGSEPLWPEDDDGPHGVTSAAIGFE
jgi:hypothetical protein